MSERNRRRHEAARSARKIAQEGNINRRAALKAGLVGGGALTLLALYKAAKRLSLEAAPSAGEIYRGEVTSLNGKEEIPNQELNKYIESLENTSVPLLRKVGRDIRHLATTKSKPTSLPEWINEDSFPMAFTKGSDSTSQARLEILWNSNSPYAFNVDWEVHGLVRNPYAYTAWMGTYLGVTKSMDEREPLVKGLFLAKEHISHMVMQKQAEDFLGQLNYFRINSITELDGSPITDPKRQYRTAVSICLSQQQSRSTTVWKTADGLPVLYLAHVFNDLVNNGEISGSDGRAVGPIMDAHRLLLDDIRNNGGEGLNIIDNQINTWVATDSLLPPDSVSYAYHNPIRSMIDKWQIVTSGKSQ